MTNGMISSLIFLIFKFWVVTALCLHPVVYIFLNLFVSLGQLVKLVTNNKNIHLGPVVQSVVSLTSSLRVISLTVLVDSIYNILIFFAEKM